MYPYLQQFHSLWAYSALILAIVALIPAWVQWSKQGVYTKLHFKLAFYALVAMYFQLTAGIYLLFTSPVTATAFDNMSATMKNPELRLHAVEHPTSMVLGVLIMTMGYYCLGRATCDRDRHKRIALSYTIALFLILGRLPFGAWWS